MMKAGARRLHMIRTQVLESQRIQHTAKLFGINFTKCFEPLVYTITDNIANNYLGGYWEFYTLSNGGFYMAMHSDTLFKVSCENGYEGDLSSDALGITACLYVYSYLSFSDDKGLAETCTEQYHWLRDYMMIHPEVTEILKAID